MLDYITGTHFPKCCRTPSAWYLSAFSQNSFLLLLTVYDNFMTLYFTIAIPTIYDPRRAWQKKSLGMLKLDSFCDTLIYTNPLPLPHHDQRKAGCLQQAEGPSWNKAQERVQSRSWRSKCDFSARVSQILQALQLPIIVSSV